MLKDSIYRKLYIGENPKLTSPASIKRVILTSQLALLCLLLSAFFVVVDIITGYTENFEIYGLLITVGSISFLLNRFGIYTLAKAFLIIGMNIIVFITYEREDFETGAFAFFIPCILSAFAIFSYKQRFIAIALAVLSTILFVISTNYNFEWIEYASFSAEQLKMYFMINFIIAIVTSILVIVFLLKLNALSESDLIKTSEELIANKLRFDLAIKGSSVGIWDWSIEEDHLFVSPLLLKMLKYTHETYENISPSNFGQLVHPDDRLALNESLQKHLVDNLPFHHECRIQRSDGKYIWILVSGHAQWNEDGKPLRVIGTVVDINELKEAFSKLEEQNELLEKTNDELDKFVYSTSHDLRAPLTSILGLINIVSKTDSADEIKSCLKMIEERVETMKSFIAEIIDYSRNSRMEVVKEEINLNELATEIIEGLKYFEKSNLINFRIEIPQSQTIVSDKSRLKIILNNLISNAVKYHNYKQDHPYILIKSDIVDNNITITVADNGDGIPTEFHEHIFDMFYRATEQSEGSGLGLYIAKEMALKLSGKLEIDSNSTDGAIFNLNITI